VPLDYLAWLGDWFELLEVTVEEQGGDRLALSATGEVPIERVLRDGRLPAPRLPAPAPLSADRPSWPYARDALPLDIDLLESWTFRSRRSGGAPPEGRKLTPFWEVDSLGTWSGPLFSRRTRVRFTGRILAPAAAVEVERFVDFHTQVLGGVTAP
jgi:hypothetical protein